MHTWFGAPVAQQGPGTLKSLPSHLTHWHPAVHSSRSQASFVSLRQSPTLRSPPGAATLRASAAEAASVVESSAQQTPDSNGAQAASSSNPALDAVPLQSAAGVDYSALKSHLAAGAFQKADDETRAKLIKLAGSDASKRNWVYYSEVQFIAADDLQIIDALWRGASNNKFGFSVQRELWLQNRKYWTRFFKAISWVQGERNNYRKWPGEFMYNLEAPKGHLPLTNCLRGTQLFEAIMQHPAFVKEEKQPDWLS